MIVRKLKDKLKCTDGGHNLNNINYAGDSALTPDTERKLQEILNSLVNKSETTANIRRGNISLNNKDKYPEGQIQIGDVIIK